MPYSLTSKKISFTYGRLVQIVSGSYYDGFGNLLNLSGSSGTTLHTGSNYPITSSWAMYADVADAANYAISSSVADSATSSSFALIANYSNDADKLDGQHGSWYQKALQTGSYYPITASKVTPPNGGGIGSWGSFWDTTIQTNVSGSLGNNIMRLNTTDTDSQGVSVVNHTQVKVNNAGVYNYQFSAQLEKTTSNSSDVYIFLRKNGVDVPQSATFLTLAGQARSVAAWNFVMKLNANDFLELCWHSDNDNVRILAQSGSLSPNIPAVPSLIVTITQV